MAALVCIAYSISVELCRVACILITTKGSINECFNYLQEKRQSILINRYLDNIDVFYSMKLMCKNPKLGVPCINCKKIGAFKTDGEAETSIEMNNCDADEFVEIEECSEAFEIISSYYVSILITTKKKMKSNQFKINQMNE